MPKRKQRDTCVMECTGADIFIVLNGVRIAKRGLSRYAAGPNVGTARTRLESSGPA